MYFVVENRLEFAERQHRVRFFQHQRIAVQLLYTVAGIEVVNPPDIHERPSLCRIRLRHLLVRDGFVVVSLAAVPRVVVEVVEEDAVARVVEVCVVALPPMVPLTQVQLYAHIGAVALGFAETIGRLHAHQLPHPVQIPVDGHLVATAHRRNHTCDYANE